MRTPEQIEARKKYRREWQRANRGKCRMYQIKHWEKKAKEMKDNAGTEQTENVISE